MGVFDTRFRESLLDETLYPCFTEVLVKFRPQSFPNPRPNTTISRGRPAQRPGRPHRTPRC